jgi:G3E family GTPase
MSDTTIQADEPAFGPTGSATIPVSLITGFLGSGKTTLLSKLLRHPGMADTAVIINEFGEIGLDHELVEKIDGETVVMTSGCLCCTVRGDLVQALRTLYFRRVRGEVPKFQRLVIETTGLADPAPILHTLMEDPLLEAYYRLDGVITTVDAVNGALQLDAQFESVKQAAVADRIVVTKTDIAERAKADKLLTRLRRLNPGASLVTAIQGEIEPELLFDAGLYNPKTKTIDVQNWLRAEAYAEGGHSHGSGHDHDHDHSDDDPHDHHHGHDHDHSHEGEGLDVNRHDARIKATCLTVDEPLEWEPFSQWMGTLIRMRGDDLLRIKGILNVVGEAKPVAIHGVQHVFHPPARLKDWPSQDRRSRLVFITRDIERKVLEDSLNSYREQAKKMAAMEGRS